MEDADQELTQITHQQLAAFISKQQTRNLFQLWGFVVWCVITIFWVGVSYDRVLNMDTRLQKIDTKMEILGEISTLRARQQDVMRRLDLLEEHVRDLPHGSGK